MWLITGATGHIGNVLVRKLLERGEKVRALILPGESRESISGLNVEAVEGDVLNLDSLFESFRGVRGQHAELQHWMADLNRLYREEPALHLQEFSPEGFRWIDCNDHIHSTLSLIQFGAERGEEIIGVFNFTPVPRHNYRVGAPAAGFWKELLNSDALDYGGSGQGSLGGAGANPIPSHGFRYSLNLVLPPLGAAFFKHGVSP